MPNLFMRSYPAAADEITRYCISVRNTNETAFDQMVRIIFTDLHWETAYFHRWAFEASIQLFRETGQVHPSLHNDAHDWMDRPWFITAAWTMRVLLSTKHITRDSTIEDIKPHLKFARDFLLMHDYIRDYHDRTTLLNYFHGTEVDAVPFHNALSYDP